MKKLLLFASIAIMVSCGKSKEEQMLTDYTQNKMDGINVDISELDFEIEKIEKTGTVTAQDSIDFYKEKLNVLWQGEQSDTLTFEYVASQKDTLAKMYQKIMLLNIKLDKSYRNYEYKPKRNKAIKEKVLVQSWGSKTKSLKQNPDSILSVIYKASYSLKNPLMNGTKQNFDKYFYTNAEQTKFVKDKEI